MPVTPFHFGAGAAVKSLVPGWFSLRVFMVLILTSAYSKLLVRFTVEAKARPSRLFRPFRRLETLTAAIIGAWSHILLDGIMHADMRPFMPFSEANPFLRVISVYRLHVLCLYGFAVAASVYALRLSIKFARRSYSKSLKWASTYLIGHSVSPHVT